MMERILLGVFFLSGWSIFSTCHVHRYRYVDDLKTWTEAQTYCRETYTDLATAESKEEMDQLVNTVSSVRRPFKVWIGVYSNIDWRWSDGYTGRGAEYRNWEKQGDDEPDFHTGGEFCLMIGVSGAWYDYECKQKLQFVCYRGEQLGPEFVFVNKKMDWSNAQRYCREKFTDLATVRSLAEHQEVRNKTTGSSVWIGLFRHPAIHWSDGYWDSRPNPFGSSSKICGVSAWRIWKWKAVPCDERLPFVCYGDPPVPVKRQVVKLKMKLGDPSVNPNDWAVKAEILKKLQDRLQEEGVRGATLKWREQPDGKVFHKEGEKAQKTKRKKTEL